LCQRGLAQAVVGAGQSARDLLHAVAMCAASADDGHLICGRISSDVAARLRTAAKRHSALLKLDTAAVPDDSTIEWCPVSEEQPTRTSRRAINAFSGSHVVLWGCGGIGSWAGEFVARAGVARLTPCDPAIVTGPLLVRQDFAEGDVGKSKAEALSDRLRSLNDLLAVQVIPGSFTLLTEGHLPDCDAVIDATVNNTVAATMSMLWTTTANRPIVARISTDRATCTLGLLSVTRPPNGPTPESADQLAAQAVFDDSALEPYRCFWEPPVPSDELNPTPGCSVPTYHGSAADLAAATGSMISLLGPHLAAGSPPGSHLIALPHSHMANGHIWLSAPPTP